MSLHPTATEIQACFTDQGRFATVVSHESTGSTNDDVREMLERGVPAPILVAAGSQTSGRGRRGNRWDNAPGSPLLFTVGIPTAIEPALRATLSPAAAVALAETLERFCEVPIGVKWPNDLMVNSRKVCGLLLESCAGGSIVIGVGLNLNTDDEWFTENGLPLASSVRVDPNRRAELLAALATSLLGLENRVSEEAELQAAFDRRDILVGQTIHCIDGTTAHTGRVHEINLREGLTLDVDGDLRQFSPHTIRVLP